MVAGRTSDRHAAAAWGLRSRISLKKAFACDEVSSKLCFPVVGPPSHLTPASGPPLPTVIPAGEAEPPAVIPPPFRVAELDQDTLLTVIDLVCGEKCRTASLGPEKLIVKYDPARTYLTMTPMQWRALRAFAAPGRSVPQVLFQLITDRGCVPLREFYELVLKAFQCGMLQAEGHPPPATVVPAQWRQEIDGRWVRGGAIAAILMALVALVARPMQLPMQAFDLAGGWLVACAAISAGYWLAGGVARRANTEVYDARLHWKTLLPHFRADLDDAIMGGPQVVTDTGLARMAPAFLALAVAVFAAPGLVLPLFGAVLFLLSPFWWSPGLVVIHAIYGAPRNDATWHFRFEPNRAIWHAFTTRLKHTSLRFIGIHSLYGTVWLGIVLLTASLLLRANAVELWESYVASNGLHFTAIAVLSLCSLAVLGVLGVFTWIGILVARDSWKERQRRRLKPRPAVVSPEAVRRLLAETLLFRPLPEADREAIALAAQPEEYPAGATLIREGDSGDRMFVMFSGRVEVLRGLVTGRQEPVAMLSPGDIFGEIALLNNVPRTRSVCAREKSVVLSLGVEAFRTLVLAKISRDQVEDTIQKMGFLQRIPLASAWSPHAMTAFSRRATFADYKEGDYLIHEGEENQIFYLLYEGQLAVRQRRKEIAQLGIGDFFGEISLLQSSVAKATVVARTPARCLVMNKRDFLQFLTKDSLIGLQFESISSQRLGQPIFPLKGKSFDVLRG